MKSRVKKLLQPTSGVRKTYSISVDMDQMEMLDKLAAFFAEKTGHKVSRSQIIEEAIGGFIDDSMEVIRDAYDMDFRMIPVATLERNHDIEITDVVEMDTIIVPAQYGQRYRDAFFQRRRWGNIRAVEEKLECMRYMAVYVGKPTSGITHYAEIAAYGADPEHEGRFVVELEGVPKALPQTVEATDAKSAAGMRSCRCTSLHLLKQSRTLYDLFESMGEF